MEDKQFDNELFSTNGLKIHALFRKQCIVNFLSIKENVYPRLVRLFYANLHHPINEDGKVGKSRLVTLLNGRTINFNKTDLGVIFGFPTNNVTDVPSNFENLLGLERSKALKARLNRRHRLIANDPLNTEITASMLTLPSRLIHSILGYCIVPRHAGRASVNQLDVFLV